MTLWEAFWTDYRTKNFHIFFAAAVLLMQRDNIMNRKYDANCILKHVNELSMKIPLEESLIRATALLAQLEQVADSLPHSVQDTIHGQSLAMSRHVIDHKQKETSCIDYSSSLYDYSPTLLNEELEVLMGNEIFDLNKDVTNQSILMIPSDGNSSKQFF
uniref:SJCHGC04806 protein n=1 Tax=Schistosoma japonicum TaxID=6182 RepID=Q5DHI3_SCHJA|nr:SJCHGC04806 protein [Schistosoma japonicum]